jgi:hypothetical protein
MTVCPEMALLLLQMNVLALLFRPYIITFADKNSKNYEIFNNTTALSRQLLFNTVSMKHMETHNNGTIITVKCDVMSWR